MFKALGRVGAQTIKYHLMLEPLELRYAKPNAKASDKVLPGQVILVWEKSPRIAKSKPADGVDGKCNWPPAPQTAPLQLITTMYKKDGKFKDKKTLLKACVLGPKGEKTLGKTDLDVASYCTDREFSKDLEIKLNDCVLICRIHSRALPMGAVDDEVSMMSGITGAPDKPSVAEDWAEGFGKKKENLNDDNNNDDDEDDVWGEIAKTRKPKEDISIVNPFDFDDDENLNNQNQDKSGKSEKPEKGVSAFDDSDEEDDDMEMPQPPVITSTPPPETDKVLFHPTNQKSDLKSDEDLHQTPKSTVANNNNNTNAQANVNVKSSSPLNSNDKSFNDKQTSSPNDKQAMMYEIQQLQATLALQKQEHTSQTSKLQQQLTSLQTKDRANTTQITALQTKVLNDDVKSQRELSALNAQVNTLQIALTVAQHAASESSNSNNDQGGKIKELETSVKKYQDRDNEITKELKLIKQQHSQKMAEFNALEIELSDMKQQHAENLVISKQSINSKTDPKSSPKSSPSQIESELRMRVIELESQVNSYQKELVIMKDECDVLRFCSEQTASGTAHENKTLVITLDQTKLRLLSVEDELKEAQRSLGIKQTSLNEINSEVEELRTQIASAESELVEKDGLIQQQTDKMIIVVNRLETSKKRVSEFKHQILELEIAKDIAVKQHSDSQIELESLRTTLQNANVSGDHNEAILKQLTENQGYVATLRAESAIREEERLNLTKAIADLKATLHQSEIRNTENQDEITKLVSNLENAKKASRDLETRLVTSENRVKALETESEETNLGIERLKQRVQEGEERIAVTMTEYRQTQEDLIALQDLFDSHETDAAVVKKKLEDSETELIKVKSDLEHAREIIAVNDENIKQSNTQLSTLRAVIESKDQHSSSSEIQNNDFDISDKSDEIATLTGRVRELTNQSGEFEVKLHSSTQKLKSLEIEISTLRADNERITSELERSNGLLKKSQETLTEVRADMGSKDKTSLENSLQFKAQLESAVTQYDSALVKAKELREECTQVKQCLADTEVIAAKTSKQLEITEAKLEHTENNMRIFVDKAAEFANMHQDEIRRLTVENRQLRERHVTFDSMTASLQHAMESSNKKSNGHVDQAVTTELLKRVEFYEQQLGEADDTLAQAKHSFQNTSEVLNLRITELENQISVLEEERNALTADRGEGGLEVLRLQQVLTKTERKCEKLSEVMSRFEVQIIEKKVEVHNLQQKVSQYEHEVQELKNNLNSALTNWHDLQDENNQLHETLNIVGGSVVVAHHEPGLQVDKHISSNHESYHEHDQQQEVTNELL